MNVDGMMMTKAKFSKKVEELVRTKKMEYIEAIVYYCEKNNLDEQDIKKYISDPIKNKIEAEAMKLNYLPKSNELPFD